MVSRRKPYVFVTLEGPDDGGDFGRNTPGTKTGGIQEALDYAHENYRDVHIFGGHGGMHDGKGVSDNVYPIQETVRVPWNQDFRMDGGNAVWSYTGNGDCVHVDSQMNCRLKFGLIVSNSKEGAAVRVKPTTRGPDDFIVIVASVLEFSAIVSQGAGLVVDSSEGGVSGSRFIAEETNTMTTGVHIVDDGSGRGFGNNIVEVMFTNQNHAVSDAVGLRIGDPGSTSIRYNSFRTALHAPRGVHLDPKTLHYVAQDDFATPQGSIGAHIFAQNNAFQLAFHGERAPGRDIVFGDGARDNTVHTFNLPHGVTHEGESASNRIVPNWSVGWSIETPTVPASEKALLNTTGFAVQVFITSAGDADQWTLEDASGDAQTFEGGLSAGQAIPLDPGDRVSFRYLEAPEWKWKAVR